MQLKHISFLISGSEYEINSYLQSFLKLNYSHGLLINDTNIAVRRKKLSPVLKVTVPGMEAQ